MKILMVNKFLYPNGGSETYIFRLGDQLRALGHQVQYFGMEHENRIVGNHAQAYTRSMDFHGASALEKLSYPLRTIYSTEARKKIRRVLDDFRPDVCHLNNFNYQLTPSIILEIKKWSRQTGTPCKIIFTAHDYQLLCPNHSFRSPATGANCEKCLGGNYTHCLKGRCIHGSALRSAIGMLEAAIWRRAGVYRHIDAMICCSRFMKQKMDANPVFAPKTIAMHNFVDPLQVSDAEKQDYVLYFGRYSDEKGIRTLLKACRALPEIPFIFAGTGPLEDQLSALPNVKNLGFQSGEDLHRLIAQARFSVYPSEWYENCPFSVMESQMLRTPVIGARIGGIPEIIRENETGVLFPSGDAQALTEAIRSLWNDPERMAAYSRNCSSCDFDTLDSYTRKLIDIYAR